MGQMQATVNGMHVTLPVIPHVQKMGHILLSNLETKPIPHVAQTNVARTSYPHASGANSCFTNMTFPPPM